jgi:tetratricopeptide (TPR) repeat protein
VRVCHAQDQVYLKGLLNTTFKTLTTIGIAGFFIFQLAGLKPSYDQARIKALNELRPDALNDLLIVEGKQRPDDRRFKAYLRYFRSVAALVPERADAVAMQGFCHFHLGDRERAAAAYEQAVLMAPSFSGFRYNLAVIYFKAGQYSKVMEQLQLAMASDPQESLLYVLSSKIYGLLMLARINAGTSMQDQVVESYQKIQRLAIMAQYRLQTGAPFPGENELELESF